MKKILLGTVASIFCFNASIVSADLASGLVLLDEGDVPAAASEFQRAFEAGDGQGAFYLGRLFELGVGAEPDLRRAAQLYAAAVEAPEPSLTAMISLGQMHLDGQVILRDYQRGAELICQAAEEGDTDAQFSCGALYQEGKGVAQDGAKAIEYWERAADQDSIAAKNFIAQAFLTGNGVETDYNRARLYFEQTAGLGNAMGLFELAKMHSEGLGADADKVEAYKLANLAVVREHPEAPQLRDALEAELSASEILQGQHAARDWVGSAVAALADSSETN